MLNILNILLVTFCLFIILAPPATAEEEMGVINSDSALPAFLPDRRKDQFSTSPGYALFPYPYILPGIGTGIGLVGGAMNISDGYTDVYGIIFGGEVTGLALGAADLHLIPQTLIVDLGYSDISKVQIMNYSERGMSSATEDYRLLGFNDAEYFGGRMTASFFQRRLELYGGLYKGAAQLNSIRDKEGDLILEAQDAPREWSKTTLIGGRIDLTDDYADPRRGIRLNVTRFSSPPVESGPDYYVQDYNLTGYLPVGKRSTWVFNHLRSDAVVKTPGESDPTAVQNIMGLNCSDPSLTTQEQQFCWQVVNNTVAHNTYGTASSLGGFSYLRSYSQGRFSGAHTRFYGTELRWNLTDESTPFDIFVMKDIRTSFQLAFFYERGSSADLRREVGDTWKESYGVGLRMITASGVVFRADIAYGDDGFEPQMFIGYPWEL